MLIRHIHLVYFSPVFHSRELCRLCGYELAKLFGVDKTLEHDVTSFSQVDKNLVFGKEEIVIFGAPVYGGRIPAVAGERFAHYTGHETPAIILVSYGGRAYEDALLELGDIARARGFKIIGAGACLAEHTIIPSCAHGRPDRDDVKSILDFSSQIAEHIEKYMDSPEPALPGNRPYREFKSSPLPQTVDDNCIYCGACVRECPTMAIDAEEPATVNPGKCICCMRCINICPVQARHPKKAFLRAVSDKLAPLCRGVRHNEFFMY